MKIILINGEIGWDITPDMIRERLRSAKGDDIDIHIASPGGFIFEGIEIFNLIRDYRRDNPSVKIRIIIKGEAASMGAYLAVNPAADIVLAEDNAVFMIHNAWSCACGDNRELKKTAELLEGLDNLINQAFSQKTGKSKQEILKLMNDETWLFGEEIKDANFVDEIIESGDDSDNNKSSSIATSKLKFAALKEKIRISENKSDIQKIAALIPNKHQGKGKKEKEKEKEKENSVDNEIADINVDFENKKELEIMNEKELKTKHPELYAEIVNIGVKKEQARVADLMAMKEKPEFKKISAVCDSIDEAIKDGKSKSEATASIMAVLSNGNIQAQIESPDDLTTGSDTSASSEKNNAENKNKWE